MENISKAGKEFTKEFLQTFHALPREKQQEIKTGMEWYLDGMRAAKAAEKEDKTA